MSLIEAMIKAGWTHADAVAIDTISRQAAIDALDKRFDNVPMEQTAEILKLRKDLRELPSIQSEQKWIPCSEKLPENDGRYLVTCSKIGAWVVDWNIWHNEPKPSWLWEQGVTAWMPMPEPYTEDGETK